MKVRICMRILMRTTLLLEDYLLQQAKIRAAMQNITLSQLIGQALRATLSKPLDTRQPEFSMTTFGSSALSLEHAPRDFAEVLEEEVSFSVKSVKSKQKQRG